MRPALSVPSRALAAERRRARLWRTLGGEGVRVVLWLVASAALGAALMLAVRALAAMEAAIVLAGRV